MATKSSPMATKPGEPPRKQVPFNPTALAIAGSMILSIILATLVTGNPIGAVQRAYATLDGQAERPVPTNSSPNEGNVPKESAVTPKESTVAK